MYWKVCECTGKAERLLAGLSEGGGESWVGAWTGLAVGVGLNSKGEGLWLTDSILFRPCLLTPTSGGNKSHERAIDTDLCSRLFSLSRLQYSHLSRHVTVLQNAERTVLLF